MKSLDKNKIDRDKANKSNLKTEKPLAEKDEVKAAETRQQKKSGIKPK